MNEMLKMIHTFSKNIDETKSIYLLTHIVATNNNISRDAQDIEIISVITCF